VDGQHKAGHDDQRDGAAIPNLNAFVIPASDCVEASRPSYIG
jgi:hypothetical protein